MFSFKNNSLEQARDLAGLVHVDLLGGGDFGQAGHGHNVAGEGNNEACACGDLQVSLTMQASWAHPAASASL